MFRTGLLLIIRRYYSVRKMMGHDPVNSQSNKGITYTNCYVYRVVPPDDKQQACSKHVEVNYWNKLKVNSASCRLSLYGYITIHGQQNIKFKAYS